MANARELLEQADALMRRGRQGPDEDIPVLTDVVDTTMPSMPSMDEPVTVAPLAPLELLPLPSDRAPADALIPKLAPVPTAAPATPAAAQTEAPRSLSGDPQVQELTEHVYVQVLQRLDLYTEKALQEHLARYLQPVIERASRELVTAVNVNIGKVLRTFIAESVEREVAQLRASQEKK